MISKSLPVLEMAERRLIEIEVEVALIEDRDADIPRIGRLDPWGNAEIERLCTEANVWRAQIERIRASEKSARPTLSEKLAELSVETGRGTLAPTRIP